MDEVVAAVPLDPGLHPRREGGLVRKELLLRERLRRTGRDVDDANARSELDDLGLRWVVLAREDIDSIADGRKVPGDLGDVDVLAAGVDAAEGRQWRRVVRDQGNAAGHRGAPTPAGERPAAAIATGRASARRPVTSSNARVQSALKRSI